ncbi:dipeptidyl-peptidase IV [Candidatus Koribacter versatilis Ellin345]|uniref:Dipeptidyl-peptidase IV n=1 Tax=Koribacter versatilis (strain Ellin345) TaxID=204669 RepID=Q1IVN9_KORVE|nr:S9 family peptidase [Candidatus Koribacter versatilis]ABF39061.1 dipeptidyl-peptidase IV [Candidatus Koribacter versatilis Ellin345]
MKAHLATFLLFTSSFTLVSAQEAPKPKQLTIEAIFAKGGVLGRAPESVEWSPDGTKVSFVQRDDSGDNGALYYVDVTTGAKPAVLVAQEKLTEMKPPAKTKSDDREKDNRERYSVAAYHWAPDSKHILFDSGGALWNYDLAAGKSAMIASAEGGLGDPKFSPSGDRISYLREHDLYVSGLDGKAKRITEGGNANVLNGEVDWVYAEELNVRSNYFWSPNGKQIVYLQMDQTKVPTYPITDYIPTQATVDEEKFPKPGDPNPSVKLGVVSATGGKTKWIELPATDAYISRFGWVHDGLLYAFVLNRPQNKLDLYLVDAKSGRTQVAMTETSPSWIETNDEYKFIANGEKLLWTSWRDGHTHIYLYDLDKSNALAPLKLERQLTRGDWDVVSIDGVNEKTGIVYYSSDQEDERQRQEYRVNLADGVSEKITKDHGTHEAKFAPEANWFVDNYSALTTPPALAVCTLKDECTTFWSGRSVKDYALLVPQFVDAKADDGTVMHGVLLMPTEGVAMVNGKVPLITNPYGGPGVPGDWDSWGSVDLFDQYMAKRGYAILKMENRGMAGRGEKFAAPIMHHMCELPLKDQLASVEQVLKQFPQLDRARLGWWGWSYGGTMTAWALEHSDWFKVGVSVAPVTDWRNYDSIYTERYMGMPKEQAADYDRTSVVLNAKQIHGRLLVVHGTSDDNVHMQNSMQFMYALINHGVPFDVQIYPRKTHSISGEETRVHLFHRIQRQFDDVLMPKTAASSTP